MSLKRKLFPCGNSNDFELLEVSSGSETESATEESDHFEGNSENKKLQPVGGSAENVGEVLVVESGKVDRKIEIVQPIDFVSKEVRRK